MQHQRYWINPPSRRVAISANTSYVWLAFGILITNETTTATSQPVSTSHSKLDLVTRQKKKKKKYYETLLFHQHRASKNKQKILEITAYIVEYDSYVVVWQAIERFKVAVLISVFHCIRRLLSGSIGYHIKDAP